MSRAHCEGAECSNGPVEYREESTVDERRCCSIAVEMSSRFVTEARTIYVQVASERRSPARDWSKPTLFLNLAGQVVTLDDWERLRNAADACFAAYAERWPS